MAHVPDRVVTAGPGSQYLAPFRDRKYFRLNQAVCELDQVIAKDEEWAMLPESDDPNWSVFRRDGFVFAARILT